MENKKLSGIAKKQTGHKEMAYAKWKLEQKM
jgi:hypothetical protein